MLLWSICAFVLDWLTPWCGVDRSDFFCSDARLRLPFCLRLFVIQPAKSAHPFHRDILKNEHCAHRGPPHAACFVVQKHDIPIERTNRTSSDNSLGQCANRSQSQCENVCFIQTTTTFLGMAIREYQRFVMARIANALGVLYIILGSLVVVPLRVGTGGFGNTWFTVRGVMDGSILLESAVVKVSLRNVNLFADMDDVGDYTNTFDVGGMVYTFKATSKYMCHLYRIVMHDVACSKRHMSWANSLVQASNTCANRAQAFETRYSDTFGSVATMDGVADLCDVVEVANRAGGWARWCMPALIGFAGVAFAISTTVDAVALCRGPTLSRHFKGVQTACAWAMAFVGVGTAAVVGVYWTIMEIDLSQHVVPGWSTICTMAGSGLAMLAVACHYIAARGVWVDAALIGSPDANVTPYTPP